MKACIIYDSITGNTKKLADTISDMFEIVEIQSSQIVFVGSWTDKGSPSQKIQEELKKIKNKKIFYFGTCGFGGSKEYFDKLFLRAKQFIDDSNEIIGHFYCQGKMPNSIREKYINALKDNPENESIKSSLDNFEKALSHPDEEDIEKFKRCIKQSINI